MLALKPQVQVYLLVYNIIQKLWLPKIKKINTLTIPKLKKQTEGKIRNITEEGKGQSPHARHLVSWLLYLSTLGGTPHFLFFTFP